jgi:hypothetical protein
MSWWEEGLRGLFAVPTGGLSEVIGRKNQLGRTSTGGLEGGVGGFITGGPIGAGMGAATGAGLSGTGTTDPYSLKGGGINFGSGLGAGGIGHFAGAPGGMFGGPGGSYGASGMSSPNMGMAGSTTGPGGMSSPLNPMSGAGPSSVSKALQYMRMMPQGGGQAQAPASQQANAIQKIYQMFPELRPGARMGVGGFGG